MMPAKIAHKYFWDVNLKKRDFKKNQKFIILRILEYGDDAAVGWLAKNFNKAAIINVLNSAARLSNRSRRYWQIKFGLWNKNSPRKYSARKPAEIWKA